MAEPSLGLILFGIALIIVGFVLGAGLNWIASYFPSPTGFGFLPIAFIIIGVCSIILGIYLLFSGDSNSGHLGS